MNDLGSLATDIVVYHFEHNDSLHPITFVSGWLEANIGQLNGYTFEEFSVSTGVIEPSLEPVEKAIFTCLYEIDYYDREQRKILRRVSVGAEVDWMMLKEGDSVIQRTNKYQVARAYADSRANAKERLDDLVSHYNIYKSSPLQVAGTDAIAPFTDYLK